MLRSDMSVYIPEDLKDVLTNIVAHKDKEKKEHESTEDLDRLYIEDVVYYDDKDDEQKEWKIIIEL